MIGSTTHYLHQILHQMIEGFPLRRSFAKLSRYLSKNYRNSLQHPQLFLMLKTSRLEVVRDFVSYRYRQRNKAPLATAIAPTHLKPCDLDTVVTAINRDSYYAGLELSQAALEAITDYAYAHPCYGERQPELAFSYHDRKAVEAKLGRQFLVGSYTVNDCVTIQALARDPMLVAIAAKFLGAAPIHIGTDLLWSFPVASTTSEQLKAAQVLHYDLDDYRSIKFFFYLKDVDPSSGAHVCVRGSHRRKKLLHQLLGQRCASIPDAKLIATYSAENVIAFCGKAGYGFAEDPCCFHKGSPPTTGERLLLQVQYALNDYGDLRTLVS